MSRTQAVATALEWAAYGDQDTYHALRDGPRFYRDKSALRTLRPRMDGAMIEASDWLVRQFEAAQGIARGNGERVDGGSGNGAETCMIGCVDGLRQAEGAIQAIAVRSLTRNAAPILRRTHDADRLTVADVARWQHLGHETAARAVLSIIETLAEYRADCVRDQKRWAAA